MVGKWDFRGNLQIFDELPYYLLVQAGECEGLAGHLPGTLEI